MLLVFDLGTLIIAILFVYPAQGRDVECHLNDFNGNASCYCESLTEGETPWPDSGSDTAPAPKSVSVEFQDYAGKLLPIITWTVTTPYLLHIEGFYIQMTLFQYSNYFFKCAYNLTGFNESLPANSVVFVFGQCCYNFYGGLRPGEHVFTKIGSLPWYSTGYHAYVAETEASVPEPSDSFEVTTDEAIEPTTTDCDDHICRENGPSLLLYVLLSLGGLLIVTIGFMVIRCSMSRRNASKNIDTHAAQSKRVLVLCDEDDTLISVHGVFADALKKHCADPIEIDANVRRKTEIADSGVVSWTTANVRNSDYVIIMISKMSQLKYTNDEDCSYVSVALNVAQSEAAQSDFNTTRKKLMVLHTAKVQRTDTIPYCSHYRIPDELSSVFNHILGLSYKPAYNIETDRINIAKIFDSIPKHNDLNVPLLAGTTVELNELDRSILYRDLSVTDNTASSKSTRV